MGSGVAASRTAALSPVGAVVPVASAAKTPAPLVWLMPSLRTGGLPRERCLGVDVVERLAHQVGEHAAGPGLDEAGGAPLLERAHDVQPAHRSGERLLETLAHVVERLGSYAREDG